MLSDLVYRLRALFRRGAVEAEMNDELRFHFEQEVNKYEKSGLPHEEALRRARLAFGGMEHAKEECREARGVWFLETAIQDLLHALRLLRRSPGFTIAAIAALALGIGANTAIFSVINTVLLRPLTYPDPGRIVQFMQTSPTDSHPVGSVPEFILWRRQTSIFEDVSAYDGFFGGEGINLTGGAFPEQVAAIHVTTDYFRLFGASIELGRTFTGKEEEPNGPHVVVLSDSLWRQRYGADPHMVGKAIDLSGVPYEVIGIIGSGFYSDPAPDLWLPFQFDLNSHDQFNYFLAAGRLKPGITLAMANAQLKIVTEEYRRKYPRGVGPRAVFTVQPLRDRIISHVRASLLVLAAAVCLVLLIACANVANLLLVRATARKREIAIRAAVGAGRARIVRQLLTESVLLSMIGGALGLVVGFFAMRGLLAVNPGNIPRIGQGGSAVTLDWRVLLFTAGVAIVTGILFGLIPALDASRGDLSTALKEGGVRSGGFRQNKTRSVLVVTEMALAIVLLIGAALLIRSFWALNNVDPGFNPHHVLTLQMSITGPRFQKTARVAQLARLGTERLESLPGVVSAAAACCIPLEVGYGIPFNIVGQPTTNGPWNGGGGWTDVSPHYFGAFRIPLIRGRFFNVHDTGSSAPVVIINQAMAHQFWPKSDPLKGRIVIGGDAARQIVGIVGNVHNYGLNQKSPANMYIPVSQVPDGTTARDALITPLAWIIRARGNPYALRASVEKALLQASGGLPVAQIRTMDQVVIQSTARQDFDMLLMTVFGGAALLLAVIGIYGLMAYSVQQRTQELGIRMALGAAASEVRNLVLMQGMRLALLGVVIGTGAAFGLTRLIASLLFGVKSWDPAVFICVPIFLILVALFAVWLPARRAARIDPAVALRYE